MTVFFRTDADTDKGKMGNGSFRRFSDEVKTWQDAEAPVMNALLPISPLPVRRIGRVTMQALKSEAYPLHRGGQWERFQRDCASAPLADLYQIAVKRNHYR